MTTTLDDLPLPVPTHFRNGVLYAFSADQIRAARREGYELAMREAQEGREPVWIVNDLGELGVKVCGRFFFLYKGENIEYGEVSEVEGGVCLHDDGSKMKYRIVGKREFGETCWPLKWVEAGRRQDRYTEQLVFTPGLSFGDPADGDWRDLPATSSPSKSDEPIPVTDDASATAYLEWALWKFIDMAGACPSAKVDPRIWAHVMVYAPKSDEATTTGTQPTNSAAGNGCCL